MYSVGCTPTWIVPVPKAIDTSSSPRPSNSSCGFLNGSAGGSDHGAPTGSARRFSSFSSLAAALKGERATPLLACLRPPHFHHQEQQTVVLPQQERLAQQEQVVSQQHRQIPEQQGAASFTTVLPFQLKTFPDLIPVQNTSFGEWLPHNEAEGGAPVSTRSKKHQRLSAGTRGKFAADPYRQGGRAAAPRMNTGPSTSSRKPLSPPRATAAVEEDVAAVTGEDAADTDDEGTEHLGGIHEDEGNGSAGYQALQNALACVVASGRSAELLIWGVRCFIERDFPCLYKLGRSLTGLEGSSELPSKSLVSAELQGDAACGSGAGGQSKLNAVGIPAGGKEDVAVGRSGGGLLLQDQSVESSGKVQTRSSSSSTEDEPGMYYGFGAQRSSLVGTSTECCCPNGNCLGRQVVVVSVEGHRQRDRRVLKWVRHNLLRSGDVVVLITAWERAEEPKYLRVPGMILSSSVDASTYNLTMATRLTSRVKHLGAAMLSDCRVYPLVVPLARATKAPVANLLCQSARELNADLLVVGSHGHTSLRQMLCGSVSRHYVSALKYAVGAYTLSGSVSQRFSRKVYYLGFVSSLFMQALQ